MIGAILTGTLDDGTAGLRAIKEAGGVAVVQDPADAVYRSMPESALENVDVDYVLPLRDIPKKLSELLGQEPPAQEGSVQSLEAMMMENRFSEMDPDALQGEGRRGHPSAFSCPDCGGVLWEIDEEDYLRFRCRVGHAFSPESMIGAQNDMLEQALWSALKTLEGDVSGMGSELASDLTKANLESGLTKFKSAVGTFAADLNQAFAPLNCP